MALQAQDRNAGISSSDAPSKISITSEGNLESFTRSEYDDDGRLKYSVDARGTVTESVYDEAGRRMSNVVFTSYTVPINDVNAAITPPGNGTSNVTIYAYDPNANQTSVIDTLNRTNEFEFDDANRLVRTWFPLVDSLIPHRSEPNRTQPNRSEP